MEEYMIKKIIIALFIILACHVLFATEKENIPTTDTLSYSEAYSTLSINPYGLRAGSSRARRAFTGMAVTGTVLFSISMFLLLPGIVLMPYGWENRWVNTHYWSYGREIYERYEDLTVFYVGVGVFTLGLLMFLPGLPLMIAGWYLRARTKGKATLFMKSTPDKITMGFAYKF